MLKAMSEKGKGELQEERVQYARPPEEEKEKDKDLGTIFF